ncbi:MAG: oxidoreductase [Cytophagaceae bacterium]|jgi:uncharacterized protein YbjT (DUF2867 family)|nr:oxidoreductase [Cytophagaceae bacterium]
MKALLVGASGLTGGLLLEELLRDTRYEQIIVLSRKPLSIASPKLLVNLITFDSTPFQLDWSGITEVYCCLGTTIRKAGSQQAFIHVDKKLPLQLAQEAAAQGVPHFLIITAMGADSSSSIFYNRIKGEVEEALKALSFQRLSIAQPSLLLGDRQEKRWGEQMAQKIMPLFSFMMVGSLARYKAIEARTVARAMMILGRRKDLGCQTIPSDVLQQLGSQI